MQPLPYRDTTPPIFYGALFPIKLTYDRKELFARDWDSREWSENKNLVFTLPKIFELDSNYTVEFDAKGLPFVSYDGESNNITID